MQEKNIPIRVLHVINSAGWECSGIAKLALGFAQGADTNLYSVECLFLRPGPLAEQFRRCGVTTHVLAPEECKAALHLLSLLRFLQKGKYHIVHLHNGSRLVQCAAKWSGARVALQVHGLSESHEKAQRAFPVVFAHEVIVVSDFMARAMGNHRVTVVHPGIEFPPPGLEAREQASSHVIGTLGRLVRVKGIKHLIVAFSQVLRQVPEARLEIAGEGPELENLKHEAERLGIASRVSFMGWLEDPREVLSRWSVYVQPSLQEAAGLSVLEASAAMLPVVASRVGGIPEMMLDGVSGYLVAPDDETGFANCLVKLLNSPAEGRKMGRAGNAFVRSRFSLAGMCSEVQVVYERLLASGRSRRIREKTLIAS